MGFGQYSYNTAGRRNPLAGDYRSKSQREKQVFDTDEIPHLWMHRTQYSARNAQGNLYFTGATIFSYGVHFPIASHVVNRNGQTAIILFTTDKYGNTTARHIHAVRMAVSSSVVRFDVDLDGYMLPDADGKLDATAYARVIDSYQKSVKSLSDKAIAAHTTKKSQEWLDSAQSELNELLRFVEFFGLPKLSKHARIPSRKLPFIPASVEDAKALGKAAKQAAAHEAKVRRERQAAEYRLRIEQWMAANPEYAARWDGTNDHAESLARELKQAEQDKRELRTLGEWMVDHEDVYPQWDGTLAQGSALRTAWKVEDAKCRHAEAIAGWLRGDHVSTYSLYDVPTMLRIIGDTVETSRGANFPVSHARKGLLLVKAVIARGQEWLTNGHTCHLGHYKIDRIEANGTVHAGCHVVTWEAIARIESDLLAITTEDTQSDCEA